MTRAAATAGRELRVEHLLGRRVLDADGASLGRIEEIVAENDGEELVVREFLVGHYGMLERLGIGRLGASLLRLLTGGRAREGARIPWHALDLADPRRPRCSLTRDALRRAMAEHADSRSLGLDDGDARTAATSAR